MSTTKIDVEAVIGSSTHVFSAKNTVSNISASFYSTKNHVDSSIQSRCNISNRMQSIYSKITSVENQLTRVKSTVENGANNYYHTDMCVKAWGQSIGKDSGDRHNTSGYGNDKWFVGAIGAACESIKDVPGRAESGQPGQQTHQEEDTLWEKFWKGDLETEEDLLSGLGTKRDGAGAAIDFFTGSHSSSLKPQYGEYKDEEAEELLKKEKLGDHKKDSEEDWYDKKGTVFQVEAESIYEGNAIEMMAAAKGKAGNASIEARVGTVEAHAKASAGLYLYERDTDGKVIRKLAPGVEAELGASIAVFAVETEGRIGFGQDNNMLGLYGDGEINVGKAAAAGKVTASLYGKDGKVNPQAYGEVKLEAVAAEAKGTAGISALGTDIGVSGSLNIGIGAHAKAGVVDGKFKVDVGASVGIGVSVGFEVDVGGSVAMLGDAIDTVVGTAKSVWDRIF